jgi:hypothetical protein
MASFVRIEYVQEENKQHGGRVMDCIYATCLTSGYSIGPVWGVGTDSVKRACAQLTEHCSCGEKWHEPD